MSVIEERREPECDGQCRPDLALYHARCPLHGAPLWELVLDIEAANAAQRDMERPDDTGERSGVPSFGEVGRGSIVRAEEDPTS